MDKKLERDTKNAVVSGVCAGLAKNWGMEVNLVRVLAVVLSFTVGVIPLIYVVMAFMVPAAPLKAGEQSSENKALLWVLILLLALPLFIVGLGFLVATLAIIFA